MTSTSETHSNQPTDRLLSWPDVRRRIPLSRATVWGMRRAGTFPNPVPISAGRVAWRESELTDWIDARARLNQR